MFMLVFNRFVFCRLARLLSRVVHQSRDFLGSDVSLGSQCGCHLRFYSKLCMHVVNKKVNYAGLLCCHKL